MPDGPGQFTQNSSCSALLRIPLPRRTTSNKRLSRSTAPLSKGFFSSSFADIAVLLPRQGLDPDGLGCSPFARHYLGNHVCFLFLRVLRCFSSPRWLQRIRIDDISSKYRVVPFGYPRIKGHLHLPAAFRSLSRPSSPSRAQASTIRPSLAF